MLIKDGLIDHWKLSDSYENTIQTGHGALIRSSASGNVKFENKSAYITGNTALRTASNWAWPSKFTIIMQVKKITKANPNASSTPAIIVGIMGTGTGQSHMGSYHSGIALNASTKKLYVSNGRGDAQSFYATTPLDVVSDEFTTIALTYDGVDARIFINGVLEGSQSYWTGFNTPLFFGANMNNPSTSTGGTCDWANGYYKNISIYNRALTNEEIYSSALDRSFLIKKDDKYYSILSEFYDIETKNYRPLIESEMNSKFSLFELNEEIIIGGEDIFSMPIMTSNTAPAPYVASASSEFSSSYSPWKAFNGILDQTLDCWATVSGTPTGWIQIDFAEPTTINSFDIIGRVGAAAEHTNSGVKDFEFQGSDDGINFTTLKTIIGETNWASGELRKYYLDSDATYRYFRLNIVANNGGLYTSISEIKLHNFTPIIEQFKPIDKFDKFNIVLPTNEQMRINAVINDSELVVASDNIPSYLATNTLNFIVSTNKVGDAQLKLAASIDNGATWLTHNGTEFIDLGITIPLKEYSEMTPDEIALYESAKNEITNNGISYELFNTLNFYELKSKDIRFSYVLIRPKYTDKIETDQLDWKFEAIGSLTKMKKIDYTNKVYNNGITFICKSETPILKMDVMANQVEKL